MINKFIQSLCIHYHHENDLSNITHIMALTDDDFKTKFLRFFFPCIDVSKVQDIQREKPDKNDNSSRVDFYISMVGEVLPYIIEVKIWDRNHHFGQYDKAYDVTRERFGYITNYNCIEGKELGYDVKTWEEFYDYMSAFSDNSDITQGFLSYLKSVCYITKFNRTMNLEGLSTIPCFIETAKKIINSMDIDLELHEKKIYYKEEWSIHQGFSFNCKGNEEKNCDGLIGLWFMETPVITLGIINHPEVSEKIIRNKTQIIKDSKYCTEPYYEFIWRKDDVWFDLSEEQIKLFRNASSYEEQYAILYEFVKEVLLSISMYI